MKIGDPPPLSATYSRGLALPGDPDKGISAVGELGFREGQLLQARIAAVGADGKVLLDIGGRLVAARSDSVLELGREVWLEVRQAGVTPWFSPAGQKGAALDLLKLLMTDSRSLAATFQGISSLAADGTLMSVGDLAEIANFFRLFGQNSLAEQAAPEKLVRTMLWLNGLPSSGQPAGPAVSFSEEISSLLALLRSREGNGGISSLLSKPGLENLIRLAEALQSFNAGQSTTAQSFANLFPCFFAQGAGWGEWLIRVDPEQDGQAEKKRKSRRIRFDLFLHMSRLGDVHVRAALVDTSLTAEFLVADEMAQEYFAGLLPELRELLAGLNMSAVLTCQILSANLLHELKSALQEIIGHSSYSIIDITA
ncbi:MAG: hypothetical protein A2511_05105 [Deltaproteobacteria bacterium RIFOXYD12_FULL_50_9]|nr:MAG: hypothetical protein A2511_05105 [Deltaproteobacteria bacterium RIFOXYD12_FULL_50_9]